MLEQRDRIGEINLAMTPALFERCAEVGTFSRFGIRSTYITGFGIQATAPSFYVSWSIRPATT